MFDDLRDDTVLTYRCAVTPDSLWLLRRLFEQWLAERHVASEDADDLIVVVNELCSSVVVHGRGDDIEVDARLVDSDVHVEVVGHDPQSAVDPDEIALARSLSSDLTVEVTPYRTRLACRRAVRLIEVA
jgi:anti-sigma regulatory factor (Ser/Thr protein kinase)